MGVLTLLKVKTRREREGIIDGWWTVSTRVATFDIRYSLVHLECCDCEHEAAAAMEIQLDPLIRFTYMAVD